MRIKEKSKKQESETSPPESADRKKGGIKALWIAFLSATGGALMESYTSFLSQNIGPLCLSFIAWAQDHVMPMPADQQIVAQLTFYMPAKLTTDHSAEIMGVSLLGRDCRRPGGKSDIGTYQFGDSETYTDAVVRASCRPSGKTRVTITPRNGSPIVLHDGFFNNGDQVEFGAVPGSYEHGVLTMLYVGTNQPSGPRVPVNRTPPQ